MNKEEQAAKSAAITAKRNEAFAVILALVNEKGSPKDKEALAFIRPSLYGIQRGRTGGTARHNEFLGMFEKPGTQVDEIDVFSSMKAGRKECYQFIKRGLLGYAPEKRKWITFSPETGIYKLEKIGAEAPKDWTGYVPVAQEIEELK